jgi:hypothetical protein
MGVPNSEVGYTLATAGKGDNEVHDRHMVTLDDIYIYVYATIGNNGIPLAEYNVEVESLCLQA